MNWDSGLEPGQTFLFLCIGEEQGGTEKTRKRGKGEKEEKKKKKNKEKEKEKEKTHGYLFSDIFSRVHATL